MIEDISLVFGTVGVALAILLSIIALTKFMKYISAVRPSVPITEGQYVEKGEMEDMLQKELSSAFSSQNQTKAASQVVKKVVDVEVARKMAHLSKEYDEKYKAIIKEKDLEYTDVNRKYQSTLGDKKQTETVLRSIAEGLVVLNEKGEIMMLNPAAERLLGLSAKNDTGKPIDGHIKDRGLVSLVKKKAEGKELELDVNNEDVKTTIKSSSAVIEDDTGQTIGMVSLLTDVTKQKELDDLKSKFFSRVSRKKSIHNYH